MQSLLKIIHTLHSCIFPFMSSIGSANCSHLFIFLLGSFPSSDNFSKALGLLRISEPLPCNLPNTCVANWAMGILFACNSGSAYTL